jgi:hypothetical protein
MADNAELPAATRLYFCRTSSAASLVIRSLSEFLIVAFSAGRETAEVRSEVAPVNLLGARRLCGAPQGRLTEQSGLSNHLLPALIENPEVPMRIFRVLDTVRQSE